MAGIRRLDVLLLLLGGGVAALWPLTAYALDPLILPVLLAATGAVVLVVARPEYGIALALALVPLAGLEVRGVNPLRLLTVAIAGGVLVYGLLVVADERRRRLPTYTLAILLFVVVAVASALQGLDSATSLGRVVTIAAAAVLFLAVVQICTERRQLLVVAAGALAGLALAGAHGLVQQSIGDFSEAGLVFDGEAVGRISGTYGHPNQYAGFLAVLSPLAASLAFSRAIPPWVRWIGRVALATALPALVFSYTRGAVGGLVLGSLIWLAIVRPRAAVGAGAAMVVVALAFAPQSFQERLQSAESGEVTLRADLWGSAIDIYSRQPLLGTGLGNFGEAYETLPSTLASASQRRLLHKQQVLVPPHANNLYLNTLAEMGILGAIALLALVLGALGVAYRGLRVRDPAGRAVCIGLGAGLLAFALHNLLEVTLLEVLQPVLALVAVAAVFIARDRAGSTPEAGAGGGQRRALGAGRSGATA